MLSGSGHTSVYIGSDSQRVLLVHALCALLSIGFNIQQVLTFTSCLWPTRPITSVLIGPCCASYSKEGLCAIRC